MGTIIALFLLAQRYKATPRIGINIHDQRGPSQLWESPWWKVSIDASLQKSGICNLWPRDSAHSPGMEMFPQAESVYLQ